MKFISETTVVRDRRAVVAAWCLASLAVGGLAAKLARSTRLLGRNSTAVPIGAIAPKALNPLEARQNEIIVQDAGKSGDPQLSQEYQEINARHFEGRLPGIPVLWEPKLGELGPFIAEGFKQEGLTARHGERLFILLNPDLAHDPQRLQKVLCHEIVHVYLFSTGDASGRHGPAFQSVLHRLSEEGAFEGEWASAGEKTDLRTWIEAESARLDRERSELAASRDSLDREAADLNRETRELNDRLSSANQPESRRPSDDEMEAAKARRDLFNGRVAEFNARVDQLNADQTLMNQQVNHYNLLMSYPDGLDEESVVRPGPETDRLPVVGR